MTGGKALLWYYCTKRTVRGKDLHDMMPEKAEDKLPMR